MITEKIINDLINQEPKTQKWLYETYKNKFFIICYRYMKNRMEAEDMMIKGFYKIFTNMSSFKVSSQLEPWMRKIMVNECLMELRKNKLFCENIEDKVIPINQNNYTTETFQNEDILKLLEKLPSGCRTIFNLFVFEGYKHKEIAEMLDISEGTSKSQLNLAKEKLKSFLPNKILE